MPSRLMSAVLVGHRAGPPPPLVRFLSAFGGARILAIAVQRRALSQAIEHAFEALTVGEWSRAKRPDGLSRIFHTRILLIVGPTNRFAAPWRAVVEKRPVVRVCEERAAHDWTSDARTTETLWLARTPAQPGCDLATFVWDAAKRVGPRFWDYDPRKNNCQHFVSLVLSAWGLLTPELRRWIQQPVDRLLGRFSTLVWAELAAQVGTRTDIALHGCDPHTSSCLQPIAPIRPLLPSFDSHTA
jgi:hypothetical protein